MHPARLHLELGPGAKTTPAKTHPATPLHPIWHGDPKPIVGGLGPAKNLRKAYPFCLQMQRVPKPRLELG